MDSVLGTTWANLAASLRRLSPTWVHLGVILAHLGLSWPYMGSILFHLGTSWCHFSPSWCHLGPPWLHLGAPLAHFCAILAPSWLHALKLEQKWFEPFNHLFFFLVSGPCSPSQTYFSIGETYVCVIYNISKSNAILKSEWVTHTISFSYFRFHLGFILAASWSILAIIGPILGPCWLSSVHFGLSWRLLAPSWPHLGPSWPSLAPSWRLLASIWAHLGPIFVYSGSILVHLGSILSPSWPYLGPSWVYFGASNPFWHQFCLTFTLTWPHLGLSWLRLGAFWLIVTCKIQSRDRR